MSEQPHAIDLLKRAKGFALQVISLYCKLDKTQTVLEVIGKQFLRSGTSVGAQYCEAYRARSGKEFISKMESSLQELEETKYWLELLEETKFVAQRNLAPIQDEARQLTAIFVASIRTTKKNQGVEER